MTREDQWMKRMEQGDTSAADELVEAYYASCREVMQATSTQIVSK